MKLETFNFAGRTIRRNKGDGRWHLGQLRNALLWVPTCDVKRIGNVWHTTCEGGLFVKADSEYQALCFMFGVRP